jgi:hypothetical protein
MCWVVESSEEGGKSRPLPLRVAYWTAAVEGWRLPGNGTVTGGQTQHRSKERSCSAWLDELSRLRVVCGVRTRCGRTRQRSAAEGRA